MTSLLKIAHAITTINLVLATVDRRQEPHKRTCPTNKHTKERSIRTQTNSNFLFVKKNLALERLAPCPCSTSHSLTTKRANKFILAFVFHWVSEAKYTISTSSPPP